MPDLRLPERHATVDRHCFDERDKRDWEVAMVEASADWQTGSAYDYLDTLSASDLAWEWLRRNEQYGDDYLKIERGSRDADAARQRLQTSWGLRFPGRSISPRTRGTRSLAWIV